MKLRVTVLAVLAVVVYGCAHDRAASADSSRGSARCRELVRRGVCGTDHGERRDLRPRAAHRSAPDAPVRHGPRHHQREDAADRARARERPRAVHRRADHRLVVRRGPADRADRAGHWRGHIKLVRMGSGEREPPVPFEATVAEAPKVVPIVPPPAPSDAPKVEVVPQDVVVDRIEVRSSERRGHAHAGRRRRTHARRGAGHRRRNAVRRALRRLTPRAPCAAGSQGTVRGPGGSVLRRGQREIAAGAADRNRPARFIDRNDLYRVRLGPFSNRDAAVAARSSLEAERHLRDHPR